MKPGIDVIVVSYQTPEDLLRFIRSYISIDPSIPCTVHIVNVHPHAADLDAAVQCNNEIFEMHDEKASVWTTSGNIGYGRALNWVGNNSERSVIACFNADTVLRDGVLDDCYDALTMHADWGILGPYQVDDKNRVTHAGVFGEPTHPVMRGWHLPDDPAYRDTSEAVTVAGSAFFVKRECWEQLRDCHRSLVVAPVLPIPEDERWPFLPTPHFFEETWMCYHARAHDWKVMYYGKAKMVHNWGGAADQYQDDKWTSSVYRISKQMFRTACATHNIECHDF